MSGRRSRTKGAAGERAVVHTLQDGGLAATKISGMYKPGADITVPVVGVDRAIEVKRHANGQARLYAWLEPVFAVIHRGDRREWLITLRLSDALEIAKAAERGQRS